LITLVQSFWIYLRCWIFACRNWWNFCCLMSIIFIGWTVINLFRFCCHNDLLCVNVFSSIFWACLTRKILSWKFWTNFFVCNSFLSFFCRILQLKSLKLFGKWSWCIVQSFNNWIARTGYSLLFFILWKCRWKLLFFTGIFLRNKRFDLWSCDRVLDFLWITPNFYVLLINFNLN